MQVTCACGKLLNVPDTLAGKNVRCPACKKVFKADGVAAPAAPAGKVAFSCSCGRKLTAPISAAGKKVSCPACNNDLVVPGEPPAPPTAPTPAVAPAPAAAPAKKESDEGSGLYALTKPHCPNCKAELDVNAQFCVQCGTTLSTGSKVQQVELQQQKAASAALSPKVKMIFIGVGAFVVLVGGLGTWLALSRHKPAPAPVSPTTTVSGPAAKQEVGITDYIPFLVRQPKAIQIKMDLMGVQQSVQAFQATSGRLPKSKEELEGAGYPLPPLPKGQEYDYNPTTGQFSVWQPPAEETK